MFSNSTQSKTHRPFNKSKRADGAVQIHRRKLKRIVLRAVACWQTKRRVINTPKKIPLTLEVENSWSPRVLYRVFYCLLQNYISSSEQSGGKLSAGKFSHGLQQIFVCFEGVDSRALFQSSLICIKRKEHVTVAIVYLDIASSLWFWLTEISCFWSPRMFEEKIICQKKCIQVNVLNFII